MTSPDKIKDWKKELRYLPQLYKGSKADILAIEDFISSLLQARNREIIEKMPKKQKILPYPSLSRDELLMRTAYNQALQDIITTLTGEDNE